MPAQGALEAAQHLEIVFRDLVVFAGHGAGIEELCADHLQEEGDSIGAAVTEDLVGDRLGNALGVVKSAVFLEGDFPRVGQSLAEGGPADDPDHRGQVQVGKKVLAHAVDVGQTAPQGADQPAVISVRSETISLKSPRRSPTWRIISSTRPRAHSSRVSGPA